MVAWFTEEGALNPVRFRIINEDESQSVIKIDKILCCQTEKLAGNNMLVFNCESYICGSHKNYQLKYELSTCKWILFKI